jgi:hypothetical protein
MLIGTILALLNAFSFIMKDTILVSWQWVIFAYVVEIFFYILVWIAIILIGWEISK